MMDHFPFYLTMILAIILLVMLANKKKPSCLPMTIILLKKKLKIIFTGPAIQIKKNFNNNKQASWNIENFL